MRHRTSLEPILLRVTPGAEKPAGAWRLAGTVLIADAELPVLRRLPQARLEPEFTDLWERHREVPLSTAASRVTFDSTGWIGGAERPVKCAAAADRYVVTVGNWATFETVRGEGVAVVRLTSDPPDGPLDDLVISAPLVLALALSEVFVLHASSVLLDGRALVFVGVSEAGKSTLASFLDDQDGFQRLTDDLTPASARSCLPHYPQPRLSPDEHAPAGLSEVPLAAVLFIGDSPAASQVESSFEMEPAYRPLSPPAATLSLVRHSVGARLFGSDVASRHLAFAAALATEGVEVGELAYPRVLTRLGDVADFLRHRFGGRRP